MYCAAPGKQLVHPDWSQIEPRLLSIIAPDKRLAEDIAIGDNGGEDLYKLQCRDFFKIPLDQPIKKDARDQVKRVHLGSAYAASTPTVHEQCLRQIPDMKYSATKLIHAKWKERYAGTVEYWRKEYSFVINHGYSESRILHRRLYYAEKPEITKTANYPIQSTASDIANLCLIQLDKELGRYGNRAKLITYFYDAFDVEVDEDIASEIEVLMTNIMQQEWEICGGKYKFPVKAKIGKLWSDV